MHHICSALFGTILQYINSAQITTTGDETIPAINANPGQQKVDLWIIGANNCYGPRVPESEQESVRQLLAMCISFHMRAARFITSSTEGSHTVSQCCSTRRLYKPSSTAMIGI
jgi:hypothetical protein